MTRVYTRIITVYYNIWK